jgi:hypothetical protein
MLKTFMMTLNFYDKNFKLLLLFCFWSGVKDYIFTPMYLYKPCHVQFMARPKDRRK